ncbi:CHASE2 domain-containing protein [Bdellovibrionota bacterium FG-2]
MEKLLQKFEKPLLICAGALALTAVLVNLDFNLFEASLFDFRISKGSQKAADASIILISIDDKTTSELDETAPLPLDIHTRFMEALEAHEPKAVGYLVNLNLVHQSNPDLLRKEWGTRFVKATRRLESRGSVVLLGTPYDLTAPPFPLNSIPHSVAVLHKDGNVFAEDKVTRRALTTLNGRPTFHLDLAERLNFVPHGYQAPGSYEVPEAESRYFFFRYHGSTALGATETQSPYLRISFSDILNGKVPVGSLRGKILLVGTLFKDDSSDFASTPYSKVQFRNPKILVHANILDSLMHQESIVRAPASVNWLTTLGVTSFVLWAVLTMTPLYGVFSSLILAGIVLLFGQILLDTQGIWIRESQPLIGVFIAYYLAVPYRLIQEYKQRWDFQQKNEVLVQVEELKTNFLSLVTHDLKTPVARIQGLAEVLMAKASSRLIERDQETIRHIISSSEELNRFISSILELNKVESKLLRIQLESKDVNQLIERCLEGFKAPARAKGIKIQSELEPLFPIKLDPTLISKVLNNLIDNAMKYSPQGSVVFVSSKETADNAWVEISVQDQGEGLTETERDSLFTRFYRAKNDATARVNGTGLGLYLTKYFVEAHNGRVEVLSELGSGSTFKILLPIENNSVGTGLTRAIDTAHNSGENSEEQKYV